MLLDQFLMPSSLFHTLSRFLSSRRFPHALLLEGEEGCGKKTLARLLAAALCCKNHTACGECSGCRKVLSLSHPDVTECLHNEKTGAIPIDSIRSIISSAYLLPNESDYKIYLIFDAEQMTAQAQNALLKILEEPPAHVIFLLTCQSRFSLLETVRSRVASFALPTPSVEDCAEYLLKRNPQWERESVLNISSYTNGNIGKALALLNDAQAGGEFSVFEKTVQTALTGSEYELAKALCRFERQKDSFERFLNYFAAQQNRRLHQPMEKNDLLQAIKITDIIEKTRILLGQNVNFNLLLTNFGIELRQTRQKED